MNAIRLPSLSQHTAVLGTNGTGKTRLAFWLFGKAQFDIQPFIVLDFKLEELFARSDRMRELDFKDALPKQPGAYIIRPLPGQEDEIEKWLWKVWQHENIGLYVDEGYGIDPRSNALQAVLTQGRSKHLPTMYLSQRPAWISRFVVSEATFLSVFRLNDVDDRKRVQSFIPKEKADVSARLPEYHSLWYDVGKNDLKVISPVPSDDELLDRLDKRLSPKRKVA